MTQYVSDLISAIHSYYTSTQESTIVAKQYAFKGIKVGNDTMKMAEDTTIIMKVVSDFQEGNAYLQPYLNDSNQYIRLTAQGMYQPAMSMLQPNEDALQAIKSGNTQGLQYGLATSAAAQDTGTNDMLTSIKTVVGFIRNAQLDKVEPTSGTIDYILSADERHRLLDKIQSEFPDGVNNYNNSIYLLMGYFLKLGLQPDTYEQFAAMKSTMTTSGAGN